MIIGNGTRKTADRIESERFPSLHTLKCCLFMKPNSLFTILEQRSNKQLSQPKSINSIGIDYMARDLQPYEMDPRSLSHERAKTAMNGRSSTIPR